jgi:hypothetical protein
MTRAVGFLLRHVIYLVRAGLHERTVGVDDTFESSDDFAIKVGETE